MQRLLTCDAVEDAFGTHEAALLSGGFEEHFRGGPLCGPVTNLEMQRFFDDEGSSDEGSNSNGCPPGAASPPGATSGARDCTSPQEQVQHQHVPHQASAGSSAASGWMQLTMGLPTQQFGSGGSMNSNTSSLALPYATPGPAVITQWRPAFSASLSPAAQAAVESRRPAKADKTSVVSHSTVEKQRRDRINSLIDQVRLGRGRLRPEAVGAGHAST
jgi:hypothetical protein